MRNRSHTPPPRDEAAFIHGGSAGLSAKETELPSKKQGLLEKLSL